MRARGLQAPAVAVGRVPSRGGLPGFQSERKYAGKEAKQRKKEQHDVPEQGFTRRASGSHFSKPEELFPSTTQRAFELEFEAAQRCEGG